jgi:hypothetical protein
VKICGSRAPAPKGPYGVTSILAVAVAAALTAVGVFAGAALANRSSAATQATTVPQPDPPPTTVPKPDPVPPPPPPRHVAPPPPAPSPPVAPPPPAPVVAPPPAPPPPVVTPPPAPAAVAPKPKPAAKPKPRPRATAKNRPQHKPLSVRSQPAAAAVPSAALQLTSDTGSSRSWILIALVAAALAVLAFAAAPRTAFPQPVAHFLVTRRLEIALAGIALVAGVGLSMLLSAVLS